MDDCRYAYMTFPSPILACHVQGAHCYVMVCRHGHLPL